MMPKRTRPPKVAPTMVVVLLSLESRVASKVVALVVAVVAVVAVAVASREALVGFVGMVSLLSVLDALPAVAFWFTAEEAGA